MQEDDGGRMARSGGARPSDAAHEDAVHRRESDSAVALDQYAARWARPSAFSAHPTPAAGAPLHAPSDSPGRLIHRNASRPATVVRVDGRVPSARPAGLHHWASAVGPRPLRLESITKCLPLTSADTCWPKVILSASLKKFETFSEKPVASAIPAARRRVAIVDADCQRALPASTYTDVAPSALNLPIANEINDKRVCWSAAER